MYNPDPNLLSQLRWWLKLPPTNLIERGDRIRFRHALYLIVHQTAAVLFGMNGRDVSLTFPSSLSDARIRLDALPEGPASSGTRLEQIITAQDDTEAWRYAADLMREVLTLAGAVDEHVPPIQISEPLQADTLHSIALEMAGWYESLPEVDAIAISGSLARGMADHGSDIDLSIYCRSIPSEYDRQHMLDRMGHAAAPLIEPACDTFILDATLVHVRYWRSGDVSQMLDAMPSAPEDLFLAEDLQICTPAYDPHHRLSGWQARVRTFPVSFMNSIIQPARERFAEFTHLWYDAGQRNDIIHRYCLANQTANDWLIALFARNHRFLSTPRWIHREPAGFTVMPDEWEQRLQTIIGPMNKEEDDHRWKELEALWHFLGEVC